jgi:hypothetical protein
MTATANAAISAAASVVSITAATAVMTATAVTAVWIQRSGSTSIQSKRN